MEKAKIKTFSCPIHEDVIISKICTELACVNHLCCIDCVLDEKCSHLPHRKSLLSLENYIEHIANEYKGLQKLNLGHDGPPKELTDYILGEDESFQNLCQHIEGEKRLVEQKINDILEKFKEICSKAKANAFASLDDQFNNFKINHDFYKRKLEKLYGTKSKENPTKPDILEKFNEANNVHELTKFINEFQEDFIDRAPSDQNMLNQKLEEVKSKLYSQGRIIKDQREIQPKLQFLVEDKEGSIFLQNFCQTMTEMLTNAFKLEYPILKVTDIMEVDSRLLIPNDVQLLKSWLNPKKELQLKLLYRATRDGFYTNNFYDKVRVSKPTVIIIQSEFDRRFGGYTDADWSITNNNYKSSTNSFLFSFDAKELYPIKYENQSSAIYCSPNYGPTFGQGHDIYIPNQSNTNKKCCTNIGYTYDAKGRNKSFLGGADRFGTKEIEAFQVI